MAVRMSQLHIALKRMQEHKDPWLWRLKVRIWDTLFDAQNPVYKQLHYKLRFADLENQNARIEI